MTRRRRQSWKNKSGAHSEPLLSKYLSNVRDMCIVEARMLPPRVADALLAARGIRNHEISGRTSFREISSEAFLPVEDFFMREDNSTADGRFFQESRPRVPCDVCFLFAIRRVSIFLLTLIVFFLSLCCVYLTRKKKEEKKQRG